MKGKIHIYTGDGKGKTTAALGLALRASGWNMPVYIVQFIKGGKELGEMRALKRIPLISFRQFGFSHFLSKETIGKKDREKAKEGLLFVNNLFNKKRYKIIILDEILTALYFDLFPLEDLLTLLSVKPDDVELLLTGRFLSDELIAHADIVTEMCCRKHYYYDGYQPRKGIEY
ncbi:cob(I)yrinic acid a,c-diamide adenosyltransferase [Chlamydiota bacterium]